MEYVLPLIALGVPSLVSGMTTLARQSFEYWDGGGTYLL